LIEVKKLLVQQYNTDFQECKYDDKEELSQEDKYFMQSVQKMASLENGQHWIAAQE
jgi:hypothetical protein